MAMVLGVSRNKLGMKTGGETSNLEFEIDLLEDGRPGAPLERQALAG
jgi:hypothetical protein